MTTISLKLPGFMLRDIEQEALTRGIPKSAVIRSCIARTLRKQRRPTKVTCLELLGDLVGSFHGPRDLSTNPGYLKKALLADATRGRKSSR